MQLVQRFRQALGGPDVEPRFVEAEPPNAAALTTAPQPEVGEVDWTPPPAYLACVQTLGHFTLVWEYEGEVDGVLELLTPDRIKDQSEVVYLPEGVNYGDGDDDLSTNHLVPFAAFDGEASFCFDVSSPGPEYTVWYHHQDNDRTFRWTSSGVGVHESEPDFSGFVDWFEWLVVTVEAGATWDMLDLDTPYFAGK